MAVSALLLRPRKLRS